MSQCLLLGRNAGEDVFTLGLGGNAILVLDISCRKNCYLLRFWIDCSIRMF